MRKSDEKKIMALGVMVLGLLGFIFSCQPPGAKQQKPAQTPNAMAGEQFGDSGSSQVERSPLIKVTVDGQQDNKDSAIVHLTTFLDLDPALDSRDPNERIILEFKTPYGVSLENGPRRTRLLRKSASGTKVNADVRVVVTGDLKVTAMATIYSQGKPIMFNAGGIIIKSMEGGKVSFELLNDNTPRPAPIVKPEPNKVETSPAPSPENKTDLKPTEKSGGTTETPAKIKLQTEKPAKKKSGISPPRKIRR